MWIYVAVTSRFWVPGKNGSFGNAVLKSSCEGSGKTKRSDGIIQCTNRRKSQEWGVGWVILNRNRNTKISGLEFLLTPRV